MASTIGVAEALKELLQQQSRRTSRSVVVALPGAPSAIVEEQLASFTVTGTLCQDARVHKHPAVALYTSLAEDARAPESSSVKLLVSKFATASMSDGEARLWFPRGSRVSIAEPRVMWAGSMLAFLVDNPASIDFLGVDRRAGDYSTADNAFYSAGIAACNGDFLRAALLFNDCVEQGFSRRFEAYSRSCDAWFNIEFYERAFQDADKALEHNPSHFGSLMVKGQALCELQEYRSALRCFRQAETLVVSGAEKNKLLDAQKRCSILYKQSVSGNFDLNRYLQSEKSSSSAPDCSDYVGPVRIDFVEGMGRGLFACRDFKAGEMIIASKSIDRAAGGEEFHAKLGRRCLTNRRVVAQLSAFFDDKTLPDLDVFRPNSGWFEKTSEQGTRQSHRDLFKDMGKRNGLCPLSTMVNHSCVPNVSRQPVGSSLMVRAARDISAGEELVACYFDPFFPRAIRQQQAAARNFTFLCRCCRCRVEEKLEKLRPGIAERYDARMRGKDEQAVLELARLAEELDEIIQELSKDGCSEAGNWVMCSYLYAYWAWTYFAPGKAKAKRDEKLEQLLMAMHATAPGYLLTLAKMVELAGPKLVNEKNTSVRRILEAEVLSCFGELKAEVVDSVICSPRPPKDDLSF